MGHYQGPGDIEAKSRGGGGDGHGCAGRKLGLSGLLM